MNLAADEDAKGIERITPLNSEQISWHSERLEYFVDLMESAFPNVFKMWRMLHECSVVSCLFLEYCPKTLDPLR